MPYVGSAVGSHRSRIGLAFTLVSFVVGAGVGAPASAGAQLPHATVAVFGDSIAFEAEPQIEARFTAAGNFTFLNRTVAASAPCDWNIGLRMAPLAAQPKFVIAETVGPDLSPCQRDSSGTQVKRDTKEFLDMYVRHLTAFVDQFPKSTLVFLNSAPANRGESTGLAGSHHKKQILGVLRRVAALRHNARAVDAGRSLETPRGGFARFMKCIAGFPCTGIPKAGWNTVRALDGVHLCPSLGLPEIHVSARNCPDVQVGSMIYAAAVAAPVLSAAGLK